jgi:hypothetical protein
MKTIALFAVLLAGVLSPGLLLAEPMNAYATSPDHPGTWESGADNIHQALRWDSPKKMLFADVKYSTVAYADDAHPAMENDYALSFPTVHFDSATGLLTVKGTTLGRLHHSFFGSEITLDKGVALSIHRHHGKIFAMIVPSANEDE